METLNVGFTRAIPLLFARKASTRAVEPLRRSGVPESVPCGFVCVSAVPRRYEEPQRAMILAPLACGFFIDSVDARVNNALVCL